MENKLAKKRWAKILGNKYFIATVLFLAWFVFFDENSFLAHRENKQRLEELIRQKEYYIEKIASDKQKLKDLNAGKEQLEKFAREQYFMSQPDEDIFIVVEEE
ncbi:MAG: FtsB family cell division protein [Tangfeifania sp.]